MTCVGYDIVKTQARLEFDKKLASFIKKIAEISEKDIIWTGDLNVNPRRQDWHEKAFEHMAKMKKETIKIDSSPRMFSTRNKIVLRYCGSDERN